MDWQVPGPLLARKRPAGAEFEGGRVHGAGEALAVEVAVGKAAELVRAERGGGVDGLAVADEEHRLAGHLDLVGLALGDVPQRGDGVPNLCQRRRTGGGMKG